MKSILKKLGSHFLAGLLVMVPLGLIALTLVWLFNWIDDILQPVIFFFWHKDIPGVGFGVIIVLIYIIGLIVSNFLGKRALYFAERYVINKIPVVGFFYRGIKQILESFSRTSKNGFLKVVFVEFPHKGTKAIGFITNEEILENGEKQYNVFVPTAPNPTTGFLLIVQEQDIIPTKMSVDEAFKLVISAGKYSPGEKDPSKITNIK
ncbi:MAG: DUF502 domain-containing protein [Dehalococcoidales bacterium]|nr:DUF502 domain-containing protein [Dehalococcoidales bacterium]